MTIRSPADADDRRRTRRGTILLVLGFIYLVCLVGSFVWLFYFFKETSEFYLREALTTFVSAAIVVWLLENTPLAFVPFAPVLLILPLIWLPGSYMLDHGMRLLAVPAARLRSDDSRPPIVYLRSFDDDLGRTEWLGQIPSEALMATALDGAGPLVAIGKPGEDQAPWGAARLYASDAAWQGEVTKLVDEAVLVVIRAGSTPGLGWELGLCRQRLDPRRLVILVGSDPQRFAAFSQLFYDQTRITLPIWPFDPENPRPYRNDGYYAVVLFDAEWRPYASFLFDWIGMRTFVLWGKRRLARSTETNDYLREALADKSEIGLHFPPPSATQRALRLAYDRLPRSMIFPKEGFSRSLVLHPRNFKGPKNKALAVLIPKQRSLVTIVARTDTAQGQRWEMEGLEVDPELPRHLPPRNRP